MKIYIVGIGGIGSALISPLGKYLKYNKKKIPVVLIDGDSVEESNLERQNFISTDVKRNKAQVMAEYLKSFGVEAEGVPIYLTQESDLHFENGSVIFVCTDNYVTRFLIEQWCVKNLNKVVIIFGGNEYHDGDVNIVIKDSKLKTPLYSETHPEIKEKDKFPNERSCAEASVHDPQLIFANMTVAMMMLGSFYSYLAKSKLPITHKIAFDLQTNKYEIYDGTK